VGLALAAAALFGASTPFAKLLLRDAAPQMLAGLLYSDRVSDSASSGSSAHEVGTPD
jgi:hypothetical protein